VGKQLQTKMGSKFQITAALGVTTVLT